jgi:hypothetical protein
LITKPPPSGKAVALLLSGRPDLNRGPHGPEPCALAGLSHAPRSPRMGNSGGIIHAFTRFGKRCGIIRKLCIIHHRDTEYTEIIILWALRVSVP